VAKILVADDNSNIQRMVGLALKDQGIDVVAVGNGEAAVRKISELRPDLVLADVFMPVRNGYEVCQYVKEDPSLAHIPVILLVGAFDPLDEQEAQRVGADGVLKKPFVPPDPLIAMVKAALDRAGISLTPVSAGKEATPQRRGSDVLPRVAPAAEPPPPTRMSSPLGGVAFTSPRTPAAPPRTPETTAPPVPAAPVATVPAVSTVAAPFAPVVGDESFVDEPAPTASDPAKHTMSFGNLLGAATKEEEAPEDLETTARGDWRSLDEPNEVPEEAEEEAVKESAGPSWRRDPAESAFPAEDGTGPVRDWRDSEVVKTVVGRQSARETWEQKDSAGGFVTAAEVPTDLGAFAAEIGTVETRSQVADKVMDAPEVHAGEIHAGEAVAAQQNGNLQHTEAASQAETYADHATSVAVEPEPVAAGEVDPHEEAAAVDVAGRHEPAASHGVQEPVADQQAPPVEERIEEPVEVAADEAAVEGTQPVESPANEAPAQQPTQQHAPEHFDEKPARVPVNNWFSLPASPWDSEARRINPLASSWETPRPEAPVHTETPVAADTQHVPEHMESGSTNGASTAEEIATVVSDEPAQQSPRHEAGAIQQAAAEIDVDDLVAKVLARMSPEVLHSITREIVKPVIAAIIADELKHKQ
jgi:CheY-like chemotaxis protein